MATAILLSPPPVQPAGGRHLPCIEPSPHTAKSESTLASEIHVPPRDSLRPRPTQMANHVWQFHCGTTSPIPHSQQEVLFDSN